jgi:hypothetical protein
MIPLNNLTIDIDEFDAARSLANLAWCIPQHFHPLLLSTFGDWFFRDADNHIHMFDLVTGELNQIADSRPEFEALLELEEYRREWLRSDFVEQLQRAGVKRARGKCYAFRTPPMLGGEQSSSNIVVWDLSAYQAGTSKVHQQVGGLPPGSRVVVKPEKNERA